MQSTGRTLDLAISGDGFFMVGDSASGAAIDPVAGADPTQDPLAGTGVTNINYTRAGNFYMDKYGYVVNGDGKYMVGVPNTNPPYATVDPAATSQSDVDKAAASTTIGTENLYDSATGEITIAASISPIKIPTNAQSMSIAQDGSVYYVDVNGKLQFAGQALLAKFPNASGLEKTGGNYFQVTANSGDPLIQVGTQAGIGSVNSSFLEMSNVDLSEEFTEMIVAQRGFQANSRIITTSDEILQELVNLKR